MRFVYIYRGQVSIEFFICNEGIGILGGVRVKWFHATFNNFSVIMWRSVLLVEETGVPRENHGPVASH